MRTAALSAANVRALWRRLIGLVILVTVASGICLAAFAITARAGSATHDSVQEGVANRSIQLDRLGDRPDAQPLTAGSLKSVSSLVGVSSVEPVTQASFGYKSAAVPGVLLYATTPRPSTLPPLVATIRPAAFPLNSGEIVLPRSSGGYDLSSVLGKQIAVQITRSTSAGQGVGQEEKVRVVGLFDPSWQVDGPDAAYLDPQSVVQWAALRAGVTADIYTSTVGYDKVFVLARSSGEVDGLLHTLQSKGFAASSLQQQLTALPGVLGLIHTAGLVLLVCLVLVAGLSAYQITSALGRQRTREIGILKAVGYADGRVFRLLLIESALVAVVAAAGGLILGSIVSTIGSGLLRRSADLGSYLPSGIVVPDGVTIAEMVGVVLLVIVVGAMLPALRAARMQPAQAIKEW